MIKLPQTGADAKRIRESFKLSQGDWAEVFGYKNRENVSSIEQQPHLSRMQKWFYWYTRKFGLPK